MKKPVILILGAGVGGLHCALSLARRLKRSARLVLVDRRPYHILHSSLYDLLVAKPTKESFCLPLSAVLDGQSIEFCEDMVTAVHPVDQRVTFHQHQPLRYDYLVIALGSQPNDYHVAGLSENAFWFNTFADALKLRKTILADLRSEQEVNLIIGGGGVAGTELAGSLADLRDSLKAKLAISVVEANDRLLPGLPPAAARRAAHSLQKRGVELRLKHCIKRIRPHSVILDNKKTLAFDLFVWTGGVKPSPLIKAAGFTTDDQGRAIVNSSLQARGYGRVYVIGDAAAFRLSHQQYLPQLAGHALHQGLHVAETIVRQLRGKRPAAFRPIHTPMIVTLGQRTGLWIAGPIVLSGRWAVWLRNRREEWYRAGLLPVRIRRAGAFASSQSS